MYDSYKDWQYSSPEVLFCNGVDGDGKCTSIGVGDEQCSMLRPSICFDGNMLRQINRNCAAACRVKLPRDYFNCSIERLVM